MFTHAHERDEAFNILQRHSDTHDVNMLLNPFFSTVTGMGQNFENRCSGSCNALGRLGVMDNCVVSIQEQNNLIQPFDQCVQQCTSINSPPRKKSGCHPSAKLKYNNFRRPCKRVETHVSSIGSPFLFHNPCNTARNKQGLRTHLCRIPPLILNLLLCLMSPITSPGCQTYSHRTTQPKCSKIHCHP